MRLSRSFLLAHDSFGADVLDTLVWSRLLTEQLKERPQKRGSTPANANVEAAEDQRKEAVSVPEPDEQAAEDEKWGKETITQKYLWPRVAAFFRDQDVIVAETGTSAFGATTISLPNPRQTLSTDAGPSRQVFSTFLTPRRPFRWLRSSGALLVGRSAPCSAPPSRPANARKRAGRSSSVRRFRHVAAARTQG